MTLTLAPETEARLLAVAMERNIAPEAVIEALLDTVHVAASMPVSTVVRDTAEQARLRAVMFELIDAAQTLDPEPFDSPTRQAYRDKPIDAVITEKFRRQGFNL